MRRILLPTLVWVVCLLWGCQLVEPSPPASRWPAQQPPTLTQPFPTASRAVFTKNIDQSMPATAVKNLRIRCGRGSLQVIGTDTSRLLARAIVTCHAVNLPAAERVANQMQLYLDTAHADRATLRLAPPDWIAPGQQWSADLTVTLPSSIRVSIYDGVGDLRIHGLTHGLEVKSHRGNIEVTDVRGGVNMESQGDECQIRDVSGLIWVKDGVGNLAISEVTGEVRVEDSRGKLQIGFVSGKVTAENNPEGIEIINIDGAVVLVNIPVDKSTVKGVGGNLLFSSSPVDPPADPR